MRLVAASRDDIGLSPKLFTRFDTTADCLVLVGGGGGGGGGGVCLSSGK
jgi:hypothetical protein